MAMLPRCFAVSEGGNLGPDGFLDGFAMVRVMRGPIGPVKPNYKHLKNLDPHGLVRAGAIADGQSTVQPGAGRIGGLEPHESTEVIKRRVNGLVAGEPCHHLGRTVPVALGVDQDTAAGLGLGGVARLQMHHAVGAHDLPVGAARQDFALELRALHRAAEDVDDAALAVRRLAEHLDVAERGADGENGLIG